MKIRTILNSGDVVRFHNHTGIDKQRNSEHQWGVALILQHIYPKCSKELLLAALTHDAHEYYVGDIPANVKWNNAELKRILEDIEYNWEVENDVYFDLHSEEEYYLKIADSLEGMVYCIKQVRLGNINAKRPYRKWREFLNKFLSNEKYDTIKAREYLSNIEREMEEL